MTEKVPNFESILIIFWNKGMFIPQYPPIRYSRATLHMDQKLWPWKSKGPWNYSEELTPTLVPRADKVGGKFGRDAKLITPPPHASHRQKKMSTFFSHATFKLMAHYVPKLLKPPTVSLSHLLSSFSLSIPHFSLIIKFLCRCSFLISPSSSSSSVIVCSSSSSSSFLSRLWSLCSLSQC